MNASRTLTRAAAAAAATLSAGAVLLAPSAANATTELSGFHVRSVSSTSFTVTVNSLGSGWKYRLFTSTYKPNVYNSNLSKAIHSSLMSTPKMTISNLRYTTSVYWWKVQAYKGTSSRRTSGIYSLGLRPAAPTSLHPTTSPGAGTYLLWSSVSTTGFVIQQATDSAFTQNVRTYSTRSVGHQFTPYGLTFGTTYFWRVRGVNHGTSSSYTPAVSAIAQSVEQRVRVVTYNVQENTVDGTAEGSYTHVPSWSQRVLGQAKLMQEVNPDVIGLQESAGYSNGTCPTNPRNYNDWVPLQGDDLAAHIGSSWKVADTEVHPCASAYFRTGVNILYNSATVTPVGTGGHWSIDSTYHRWAAYQLFQKGNAQFLFVDPHLVVNNGSSYDTARENETKAMISDAQSYAASHGNVGIIYAGDFNSHDGSNHPLDGPAVAMRAAHAAEGLYTAQSVTNSRYDSANDDERTPPAYGHSIDHVYASAGVGVVSWGLRLDLSSGQFVGVIPSDHNPLWSDLVIPYAAG